MIFFQKYLWVLFIFSSVQSSAQGLLHTTINYTTEQGLAGNEVVKVLQDKHGFIWAATHNGLSKFDGYSFKNYTFNPADTTGLRSIWVTDLAIDTLGTLWISTEWGIAWYDENQDRFRYINDKTELVVLYKAPLTIAQDGTLWFAAESGLYKVNTATKEKIRTALQRIPDPQSIVEAPNGEIWIGTRGHGFYKYANAGNTFAKIQNLPAFESMHIMQFIKYNNELYAATSEGLMLAKSDADFKIYNKSSSGEICNQLMCVTPYQGNYLLCGTYDKRLFLFDITTKKFIAFFPPGDNLPVSIYYSLYSHDENIWFATQNGLSRLKPGNKGMQHNSLPGISNSFIQHVISDNRQKICFGFWQIITFVN